MCIHIRTEIQNDGEDDGAAPFAHSRIWVIPQLLFNLGKSLVWMICRATAEYVDAYFDIPLGRRCLI